MSIPIPSSIPAPFYGHSIPVIYYYFSAAIVNLYLVVVTAVYDSIFTVTGINIRFTSAVAYAVIAIISVDFCIITAVSYGIIKYAAFNRYSAYRIIHIERRTHRNIQFANRGVRRYFNRKRSSVRINDYGVIFYLSGIIIAVHYDSITGDVEVIDRIHTLSQCNRNAAVVCRQ